MNKSDRQLIFDKYNGHCAYWDGIKKQCVKML